MTEKTSEHEIIIIDALMGTGKSNYLINLINENPQKHYLVVVPTVEDEIDKRTGEVKFESEATRYSNAIDGYVHQPQTSPTKTEDLRRAIVKKQNIVTSHALIQRIDDATMSLLKDAGYILIIDECLTVVCDYFKLNMGNTKSRDRADKRKRDDIKLAFLEGWITTDENGLCIWNQEKDEQHFDAKYAGSFLNLKTLCKRKSLMRLKKKEGTISEKIVIWAMPVSFFSLFDTTYIATYLWEGSIQKAYFDMYHVNYAHMTLRNQELYPFEPMNELALRQEKWNLINLYEGSLNKIGEPSNTYRSPLNKDWYNKSSIAEKQRLKKNTEDYFKNSVKTASAANMYTTFKDFKNQVKGERYTKGFVSCNAKGTNEYRHKKSLAYLINIFPDTNVKNYLRSKGIEINSDLYALSEMLQWIWRSAIRDGERINLYVPSQRMRNLLRQWKDGKI